MSDFRFEGSKAFFEINLIGSESKNSYLGEFSCKCFLSPLDIINADKLYREFLGEVNPYNATTESQSLAFALSQLKYRLLSFPEFFKSSPVNGAHLDKNVLIEIVNKTIEAEMQYAENQNKRIEKLQENLKKAISNKQIKPQEEELEEELEQELTEE